MRVERENRLFYSSVKYQIIFALLFPLIIPGQEGKIPKSAGGGPVFSIGAGHMFGGNIGLRIENEILWKEKLRISLFISAGVAEGETDTITGNRFNWFGYALGANLEYGKKSRIIFGPHLVGNNLLGESVIVRREHLAGLSLILGYKGMTDFGLMLLIYIGDLYIQSPTGLSKKYMHNSHFGLGIGYKF